MNKLTARFCLVAANCLLFASFSLAQNPQFQDFFDQACANSASGSQFDARCNDPADGSNLSGDSESSLTPSHMLSSGDTSLLGERDKGGESFDAPLAEIGPLSISASLGIGELDAERDKGDSERGYRADTESFALTFDYRHSETLVSGAILSAVRSELEFETLPPGGAPFTPQRRAGRYESDAIGLTLFVSHTAANAVFIDASLGYSDVEHDFERNSVYQASSRTSQLDVTTSAETDGETTQLNLRLGRHYTVGRATFTPQIAYLRARTDIDGYTERDENNSGLAMRYNSYRQDSALLQVGSSAQLPFNTDFGVVSLQFDLQYHREFERDDEEVEAIFVGDQSGTVFVVAGDEPDQSYFRTGLSAVAQFARGWSAYLSYQQWLANNEYDQYQSHLGIRKEL
jgi:outer membrane autotransporter protein